MSDESKKSRVFQEIEIAAILKRAAEIQGEKPDEHSLGLTQDELSRVARDAGIDSASVAAAIRDMDLGAETESFELQEDNTSVTIDRVVGGVVDDDMWESLIAELRRTFRVSGKTVQRGTTREWILSDSSAGVKNACVSVTPQNSQSQLQLMWSDPTSAMPGYIVAMVLSIILIPVIFEGLGLVSVAGGVLYLTLALALFSIARLIAARLARSSRQKMEKLVSRLETIIASSAATPSSASDVSAGMESMAQGASDSAGRIELDELDVRSHEGVASRRDNDPRGRVR